MQEKKATCMYYTAAEVQDMLGVSRAKAYSILKDLNRELEAEGYIVIPGRIPKKFFAEKYYGMQEAV